MRRSSITALAGVIACAAAVGCGSSDKRADGGGVPSEAATAPIKVGNVSTLSGSATYPEASAAAKAYFDRLNENGGINGRKVELQIHDDRSDPQTAAQVARRLVAEGNVVANVASASLLECSVNGRYYGQHDVVSIQSLGTDPACFTSANIASANAGPFVASTVGLYYMSEVLRTKRNCYMGINVPGWASGYESALENYEKLTGDRLTLSVTNIPFTGSREPDVIRARDAGCEAVYVNVNDQTAIPIMKAVESQKVRGITWIMPTPAYTTEVLRAAGTAAEGTLFNTDFAPWSEVGGDDAQAFARLMDDNDIAINPTAQGGYIAAMIFAEVVGRIDGEVTREAVTRAFKEMDPVETDLLGGPWVFGPGEAHTPNSASKFMRVQDGRFVPVDDQWFTLPADD